MVNRDGEYVDAGGSKVMSRDRLVVSDGREVGGSLWQRVVSGGWWAKANRWRAMFVGVETLKAYKTIQPSSVSALATTVSDGSPMPLQVPRQLNPSHSVPQLLRLETPGTGEGLDVQN